VGDIKDPRDKSEDENASVTYSCNDLAENAMTIPAGYHKSFYLNSQAKVKATNLEKEMIPLSFDYKVNGKEMTKTLLFPASRLIAANDDATAQLVFKYDNAVFYIDNYNMYINEDNEIELSIWGILFLK
jgi:galactose mutarotase-like enzyme